ncbi:MAG: hypothetical protein RLZZ450_2572 [Pseudomonadota bacterium]|jgi:ATP-binding cassette subfamily B protein
MKSLPNAMRRHVPEVLQTSSMDCGPAALCSLLRGMGRVVDYARLRDACNVQLDGTSIDTLEELARELGLDATQMLLPLDCVLLPDQRALPAIAVVTLPGGLAHFVVIWRRVGQRVLIMDPARGRRWLTVEQLQRELFVLRAPVSAQAFRVFAATPDFIAPLSARLHKLVGADERRRLLAQALRDPTCHGLAKLDAVVRATESLVRAGALRAPRETARLLARWCDASDDEGGAAGPPAQHWFVSPAIDDTSSAGDTQEAQVVLSGAVVLVVRGVRSAVDAAQQAEQAARSASLLDASLRAFTPTPTLAARCVSLLGVPGGRLLALLVAGSIALALGGVFESVLLRGQLDLSMHLSCPRQRQLATLAVLSWLLVITVWELWLARAALALGRHIEAQLRIAVLRKLPRLHAQYFHTRAVSDLAERSHMVHLVRGLPSFATSALRALSGLAATALGMVWLSPDSVARVIVAALASLLVPLLLQRSLVERDGRLRAQTASLSRLYFDVLRGATALRAHRGQDAMHAEHEGQLHAWRELGGSFAQLGIRLELIVGVASAGLTAWLFWSYMASVGDATYALLFLYWALTFPAYGRELALLVRQLPSFYNVLRRLFEPLDEPEVGASSNEPVAQAKAPAGLAIRCTDVEVRAGGQALLSGLDLSIARGEHVAVVGASGAGKSTLIACLLGVARPSHGVVSIDGEPLTDARLPWLRAQTAWVDPSVQLWNRSLYDNVGYGREDHAPGIQEALRRSEVSRLAATLPDGLQTTLGEAGRGLSGGEGQRVRFARGLCHRDAKLVLLDEPLRGLDRSRRERLLLDARELWADATLVCVTHDVVETLAFDRVLVFERGRLVEDGVPRTLCTQLGSRYAALLGAEREVLRTLRRDRSWRRLWLEGGALVESLTEIAPHDGTHGLARVSSHVVAQRALWVGK